MPDRSALSLTAEASLLALKDAGLSKHAVDGVLCSHSYASPFHRFSVALSEYLGIAPSFANNLEVSGATASTMFGIGAAAIDAGIAKVVLVAGGDCLLTGLSTERAIQTLTEARDQQYEVPFGIPVANTFAMTALRHMAEFGTTPEQLAQVAVTMRRHASQTPGAHKITPISVEDVRTSTMVTTPYHKLDCSLVSDGAAAFLLASAEHARELGIEKPIYILGHGEHYSHEHIFLMPSLTTTGATVSSGNAYRMAGYRADEMDIAGIYDCFTGTAIMMLEDLGFCPKGEGGPFVADGQITYGGKIPVNTHGGLLSFGHSGMPGVLFHFYEVIRQLRRETGPRQVADVNVGVVHALGAGFATNATTVFGTADTL
ncbi:MAG: thiolase family protein [Amaricoccus sp.]